MAVSFIETQAQIELSDPADFVDIKMGPTGLSQLAGREIQDIIEAAKVGCSKVWSARGEHFGRVDLSSNRNDFIFIE